MELAGTKTRLEAMQSATSKEIDTLKAKLQKKSDKLVSRNVAVCTFVN